LHYAGIGSRVTPNDTCRLMSKLSARLERLGFILRSGGAVGADTAFEQGVSDPGRMKIYRPYDEYGEEDLALMAEHIERYHPKPWVLQGRRSTRSDGSWSSARRLMGRNTFQILGTAAEQRARVPVSSFVICWTQDGAELPRETGASTGGTGQAIRIAGDYGVPVFNLAREGAMERLTAEVLRLTGRA
jgi:hypothetical protein